MSQLGAAALCSRPFSHALGGRDVRLFRSRRLTPPSTLVFAISLILAVLAVASVFFHVPVVGHYFRVHGFWIMTGAYALLAAGVILHNF